ncbi:MAG: DUF1232 domain-containing protein [Gaiellales bacterium]|nr:MAG: DUF1232 domain-containing protein [Gaiellales bacterium]
MKADAFALYLARRDPRVPWRARALAVFIAGYALSPVDLIPDFIPVIGYLDDLIVVPLGIALVVRMIPHEVWAEYRERALTELEASKPKSRLAAVVVIAIWLAAGAWAASIACRWAA